MFFSLKNNALQITVHGWNDFLNILVAHFKVLMQNYTEYESKNPLKKYLYKVQYN